MQLHSKHILSVLFPGHTPPRRATCALHLFALFFALAAIFPARASLAQEVNSMDSGEFGEYAIKAAFIYNFIKLTEFRVDSGPILLCVVGNSEVQHSMRELVGKEVGTRTINVQTHISLPSANNCQVLFLGGALQKGDDSNLAQLSRHGVLTIGEDVNFAGNGGMVQFFLEENKVRFQINPKETELGGLKFSSKLLSLAKIVDIPAR